MYKKVGLILSSMLVSASMAANVAAQEINDQITVQGQYLSLDQLDSVKTPTPIIDVPQSLSIVSGVQIAEQGFTNLGDILRYTPGLSISQGEAHRDAINIRGNQTTADFFLNGIRDDVQYFRPLYNLQQVEILRGSNALLFGRGGGGGVINRVTKQPELGESFTEISAGLDTFGAYALTGDTNIELSRDAAFRLNAFVEALDNHRDAYDGTRYGVNPTLHFDLSADTSAVLFYEYLNDDRVVDRGVPSITVANGPDVPLEGYTNTFFGSPDQNFTTLEANILRARVDHTFNGMLRGNLTAQYADYDKLYQNLYPAGHDAGTNEIKLDGYRDPTQRENMIVQANLIGEFDTGAFGHTLLVGAEFGSQDTHNRRFDNFFTASNDDQIWIPLADPITIPEFGFNDLVRDRESSVEFASFYIQDQIDIADNFKLVIGARFDEFDVAVYDRVADAGSATDNGRRNRVDEEISPRFGFVWKPADHVSIYTSYSETFLPSAGDQFLTLSTTSEDLAPQSFENREIGLKWDIRSDLSLTAAVFSLERGQFTSVDPDDASIVTTVPGSTTEGFEIQLVGVVMQGWTLNAGYSYLDGQVEGGSNDGNVTRQTPEHMFSLWNRYQATDRLGLAIGMTYQDTFFVREDNNVQIPSFTRFDAAAYYDLSDQTVVQINIENLTDVDYFPDAHSNDNITTGEPLNARVSIRHRF